MRVYQQHPRVGSEKMVWGQKKRVVQAHGVRKKGSGVKEEWLGVRKNGLGSEKRGLGSKKRNPKPLMTEKVRMKVLDPEILYIWLSIYHSYTTYSDLSHIGPGQDWLARELLSLGWFCACNLATNAWCGQMLMCVTGLVWRLRCIWSGHG